MRRPVLFIGPEDQTDGITSTRQEPRLILRAVIPPGRRLWLAELGLAADGTTEYIVQGLNGDTEKIFLKPQVPLAPQLDKDSPLVGPHTISVWANTGGSTRYPLCWLSGAMDEV